MTLFRIRRVIRRNCTALIIGAIVTAETVLYFIPATHLLGEALLRGSWYALRREHFRE